MKISDLINKLEKMKKIHGDICVVTSAYNGGGDTAGEPSVKIASTKNEKLRQQLGDALLYIGLSDNSYKPDAHDCFTIRRS